MSADNLIYTFCAMQPESLVVLGALQEKKEKKQLGKREDQQLRFLMDRRRESQIWLLPALIFAAANQNSSREFLGRAVRRQQLDWQEAGISWLRRYPAFLNKVGWQERRFAILAAGFFVSVEDGSKEDEARLRDFLAEGWNFLWNRIEQEEILGAADWTELLKPWEDSEAMECAMAAVFLCMANLQRKPVGDIDQLWRALRRLKLFAENCIKRPEVYRRPQRLAVHENTAVWPADAAGGPQQERLEWLLARFKNPQKLAYLKEKGRISSEWMDTLFSVMEKAGLPRSACESMQIGGEEVMKLLECFTDRASERQYITFLLLYTVSRELVKAGQVAAGRLTEEKRTSVQAADEGLSM